MSNLQTSNAANILTIDPGLEPHTREIERRMVIALDWLHQLDKSEGGIQQFAQGYLYYGINTDPVSKEIVYREWIPNAIEAYFMGEFNGWDRWSHRMHRANDFGTWEIRLKPGSIPHNTKVKLVVKLPGGDILERIPAWSRRVVQDLRVSPVYDAVYWQPPQPYKFKNDRPRDWKYLNKGGIKVYEAHIGISTPEPKIGSYREFREHVLPRIVDLGYNAIQLMAVMEHAYYGSFGYQITSFFAISSRFGTPEELMELIDAAHEAGLVVLLDVVHSHASKNSLDGLNYFDGTEYQYFHSGRKGTHDQWDSRLFNYGKHEVLRFLLSNLRFYLDVYHFDGFRFDGVTSMLYVHHGIGAGFSGGYHEYFGSSVDEQAINFLILANHLIKSLDPRFITVAEDVSGMPTLCLPTEIGGIGFDYRLAMAIPDMWIKILKEKSDDEWDLGNIAFILTNRRHGELTISYAESHDQALVGDKTLAFWLMDKLMYTHMSVLSPRSLEVDRGIALHKLIRFVTHALGGEGYLNFEGNEFGHPEWLDFPREGNGESYHYARRQFNLVDDDLLLYHFLYAFDSALQHTESRFHWLQAPQAFVSRKDNNDKMLVFDRAGVLFVFNFHPTKSFSDYRLGIEEPGKYRVVLSTDDREFWGQGRIDHETDHLTTPGHWDGRAHSLQVYIPSRTAIALAKVD